MSVENNVPAIRFKGFSREWCEIDLASTCSNFRSGKFIKAEDIKQDGAYPVYGGNGLRGFTSEYNHEGVYALIGRQGALCGNMNFSYGKAFFTEHAIAVQANAKNDTLFLYYKLGLMNLGQYSGQSAQPGLSVNKITELETYIPEKQEQTAIGNTFQKLDSLIKQHQQKHDKLSNIKKAMLEKMFPKLGETIPEIRFKGFSGEWEESTLAEEAVVTTGYPFDSADFSEDGDLLVVTNGNIQNSSSAVDGKVGNRIASEKVTHLNQYKLNFGDILVTMDGSVGRTAKVIERNQILAQRVGRLVARNDTEFLYQSLNTGAFLETMTTISHGGTIKHISLSEIGSYIVQVPKDLNEQAKIGAYLKNLDDLIERHHKQITKLNNIKQACLSKMFV